MEMLTQPETDLSPITPPLADAPEVATLELPLPPRHLNSVDATMGQPIVARVLARKQELEALLAALPEDNLRARTDIDLALTTIKDLLTGDLAHVPAVVVSDMSHWLERNKHLAESAVEAVDPDIITAPVNVEPAITA
ncbi:MAG: hypothetical protein JWO36_7166 [Myxococcales bacterium]|nr:hypothetical protein [Myxococcales bacterium]